MKQVTRSFALSLFCLRVYLLVTLGIISTPSLGEVNKHDWNKVYRKERSDSIKNSEKSAISPHHYEDNKVDDRRSYSTNESVMINDKKNSVALNRFLEDVLNAQNDLKWIATRHINHKTYLDNPLAHINQYSTVAINTGDVLERADIGYGSRLRGKRGFDRNYETMWMLQKKKYGRKSTRDVPQRVYLDNDMTFKRDVDNADINALYRSHGTLDKAIYDGGTMVHQPLKDWTGKKNLYSSGDWSNSNENPKITNGENTWLRDYEPAREILVNSDASKNEKLHVDTDPRDQLEVVSLHDPIYANDYIALGGSPDAIRNDKTRNAPPSLESLKKTVLELRNSLMLGSKRRNIITRRASNWWNEPRTTVKLYDFGGDSHSNEETIRKLKKARNIDNEDENDSRIFQGIDFEESYFGKQNSQKSHDRSKRSKSFVADSNYTNNQKDIIPDNNRNAQIIKDVFENVTTTQSTKEVVMKLYSNYLNDDGKNSINASNKINISDSQYSLDKGSFLNNYFNNLTITPSIANKTNISGLRNPSNIELHLNDHFINNKSIKAKLQTHLPEYIKSEIPTNSKDISQRSTTDHIKNINHTSENYTNLPDFKKNAFTTSNAFTDSINGADDFGKFLKNRNGEEKLGVAAQKISRRGMNDGQSKDAKKEFPRGNTSRSFSITTNELWSYVETTVAVKEKEIEVDGMRKQNCRPIPDVIKVFEPRGRPYQKQEAGTTARLSRQMGKDGMSVAKMKTSEDEVDKSRNTNAREDSSTSPIDSATDATMKPEAAYINTSETGESIILKDLTSVTVDNDSRKQQQMVPPLSAENRNANKSIGNLDTDRIDIRILGSNGNETINVKEDTRIVMEAHEYHKSDNNLQRKLLWISTIPINGEIEDSSIKSTRSVFNITESGIENVTNENRQQNKMICPENLRNVLTKVSQDKIEESHILQDALNSQISQTNHYARYKRSIYPYENLESNNEADSENIAAEKESAVNHDEEQKSNEDYLNQNIKELKRSYNDREEDTFEDDDKAMEIKREGQSPFRRRIDPIIRAKVNMLIKRKLDEKHRGSREIVASRKKRHSTLDMVEYYDYDDNEEKEHDAPINEQKIQNKDNKLSFNSKMRKRDGKRLCKINDLVKKKNEQAEAMMKEKLRKAQIKHKEPKEEIIIDLGKRTNKTAFQNDEKPLNSLGSSFENVFNEEKQLSTKENSNKIRQRKDFENNVHHGESIATKSKWLDQPFEDRMALSKTNSESPLEDSRKKITSLNKPLEYVANADVNPDIKNILLDIQPIEIMEQSRELGDLKDFYEDFGGDRSEDYYQENDSNNVKSLYEELKNVYNWPDGELKSGSRLRGDQRLHYESDNILDTNPQLQPLNDRFLGLSQNDNTQRRFQSIDPSWMNSNSTLNNYFELKVTDNVFGGGFEQSSTEENSPNIFLIKPTESRTFTERSIIDRDSGSPYENSKYIESKTYEVLKQNLEKQAAINSEDLHESFVESLDWHDDSDDNVKVRFGRGLKAINEIEISDFNQTYNQDNKLAHTGNAANVNFKPTRVSSQTFHDNSSISQDWHNNTMDLYNIFNNHHGVSDQSAKNVQESILTNTINMNGDKDLEAAEQRYVNNQTPRIRRAVSYRTLYDDLNQNQRDSDEMDRSLGNQFHSPNIFNNPFDRVYRGYETGNWNSDIQDLDQYSKIPRVSTRKKKSSGKKNKRSKHSSEKYMKKSSSHSSSRDRRHHAHRSDTSKKINRNALKPKQKNKAEASPLNGRTRFQKSKTTNRLLRAGVNEVSDKKVFYENTENQSTVKPEEDDAWRKEITLLLAADNIDDESQMDVALHGELAGKIVEQIFQQVQKNDQLKSVFGPGLHRDHKTEDVITGNIYRQGVNKDGTNHTETMIKKVTGLLGTLILDEVQKKTCISLSPNMREFLGWMLEMDREQKSLEETPPLPLVREKIIPQQATGRKFLFDSTFEQEREKNINDLQKKVKVLETLVKEYNALTAKEKTRVQSVHDYLLRELNLLLRYIEAQETTKTKRKPASVFSAARAGTGSILQYQSTVPNTINASYSTKDAFSLPIDTHNLFQFNNISLETTDKRLHDSHVASRHRETRSLDRIPSKRRRKTKHQKFRKKKNENQRKSKHKYNKNRRHLDRAGSSPGYRKSRRKRANPEENDQASLYYLGYEKPRIYDSFDLLDAKLRGKKKKRKRELDDKKNAAIEKDGMLDLLIKGKNRMEDEVILLNKREAWKRENEEQLEEVAFGKDMRNNTRRERERFEKLTEGDKCKPINELNTRMKRENIIRGTSTDKGTDYSNKSHIFEIRELWNNSGISNNNSIKNENELELAERKINVFADNKTNAAIDFAATEVSMEEKLVTNAGTNNQVKGKLRAINRETKIDKTDGSMSFVNLTSNAKPWVSKERQKVSEKEADDNAVKFNRTTNYRREEIDPEIELKNLKPEQEKRIYDAANWKMTDYFYDDDNLSRNKLNEKYVAKLDELGDLDTDPENNLVLLGLRNNKWSNDVVEWKLLPIIKQSPYYYDDHALSRIRVIEKETPTISSIKGVKSQSNAYLNSPKFWRLKHRRRNSAFNISPILRITDNDNFPRRIHRKAKRTSEIERLKDLRIDPKIILKVRRLSRPRNNKRSNSIAEFRMPFVLKDPNRKSREILRSRDHPELGVIYDGVGLQLPVWPYQYDDFADSSILHFAPNINGRNDDVYQYPAEMYLEYSPFKKYRVHDANQRFARRNKFRLRTSEGEDTIDFSRNNLTNKSSKSKFAQRRSRMETDKSVASGENYLMSGETKYTQKNTKESNETKTKLTD